MSEKFGLGLQMIVLKLKDGHVTTIQGQCLVVFWYAVWIQEEEISG